MNSLRFQDKAQRKICANTRKMPETAWCNFAQKMMNE